MMTIVQISKSELDGDGRWDKEFKCNITHKEKANSKLASTKRWGESGLR